MGDFKDPTALLKKSRGISPVLAACPISDSLITQIPADEEPLCGNAAVYAVIVIIVMIIIVIIIIQEKWCCATLGGPLTIDCTYLIATFRVTPSLSFTQGKFGSLPAVLDSNLCYLYGV